MRRRLLSAVGAVLALICALGAPSAVGAAEAEEEHRVVTFSAKGTNGFTLMAIAIPPPTSSGAEGEGSIGLFLERGRTQVVTYAIPEAKVTATRIEADLGALGKIALTRTPTGRTRTVHLKCAPGHPETYEFDRFEGTIEFHGEEGFTEVDATHAKGGLKPWCGILDSSGGAIRKRLPGARLSVSHEVGNQDGDGYRVDFDAVQARPGTKTRIAAEIEERQGEIEIHRGRLIRAPAEDFTFDPRLRGATVKPPAPFSGFGHFEARPGAGERARGTWTGNLTVDLPGHAGIPVSGPGFWATLTHPAL